MEFRLFPHPKNGDCTPFVAARNGSFARYCNAENGHRKLVPISFVSDCSTVEIVGDEDFRVTGFRRPDRRKVLSYLERNSSGGLRQYVDSTYVLPTYAPTAEEAFIKTVIRQVIRADHARALFSKFVNRHGYVMNGVHGFPTLPTLAEVPAAAYRDGRLGFKAGRLHAGLECLAMQGPGALASVRGLGAWSQSVIAVELGKDYQEYPFWDKSGEAIQQRFGIDLSVVARRDRVLAADLYIYGASLIESQI
jgi:hypothetical protein